ncbi:ATP-binding cassette domain-containing protein [Rhizobium pusense]|uniref:ATPase component of ABC transporters with duplicated ATPase domain n=1 Tax=Agrobacterium genomosp. 2 str. CFBP 5494 TaxID=1183436 RepID=A0A9W5F0A7_9HYPH|nr:MULTISPECIES: ABC-F family ATP-binding cassette domain-containing protein [Rhizobium/Agrobacterium group]MDH0911964.1 ATP-binding cassette domain-containing protein [Agrobacterium pusense]MDH1098036.1 ATP-binding cassette domain-containing protein [Agrobacterium pusense]MDH1114366.1 ATP-binding cassette domain-containing protein [Agrobacterium pusense]MDH2196527.1 ATP-binding cassette domain-containing protein [Agrobacterium pusense]OJH54331.1 ABC transporter [Agrobacterium pusense]
MTIITLRNLGIILGKPLFSNLSLTVNAGDRIGIVAANGCGKSTLLNCLVGDMEPSSGDITRLRGLTQSIVRQNPPAALMELTMRDAVLSALPADTIDSESWRADIIFDDMLVPEPFRERRLKELSGGWQRLAMLAKAWITEPDVLLLDEPTNHLDLEKINVLESWLGALPRDTAVIIVSHDRAFLDNVTRTTLFLRPENSALFRLPYGRARAALEEEDAADERRFQRDMKTAQQLRRQAAKLNNIGINSGSDLLTVKTKQLRERAERIEEKARPAHIERSAGKIQLANRGTHAKVLVTLEDVAVSTPDGTVLFRTDRQFIRQGDRIVILGRNGVGKTRLMSLLQAAVTGDGHIQEGIKATPSLVAGYVDQSLADIDDDSTPATLLSHRFDIGDQRIHGLLAGAGIDMEMQKRRIATLSGGQKARLAMLALRLAEPNFYLLDEPTNHLDIEGQEALEAEIISREASCVLVSHDRSFVRTVGNRFWLIDKRRLVEVDDPEAFFASA